MLRPFALALVLALAAAVPARAEMTAAERQAIEKVVRDYLLRNPEILIEMSEQLERREKGKAESEAGARILENRTALFRSPLDHVVNPDGTVPMVEFFDYNCGYCKRLLPATLDLQRTDTRVRFVFKELPILGPGSVYAARAAIAAKMQGKYLEFHNALMAYRGPLDEQSTLSVARGVGLDVERLRKDMSDASVEREIEANRALAERLGIRGTPTIVVGDRLLPGAIDRAAMAQLIDEAAANCRAC